MKKIIFSWRVNHKDKLEAILWNDEVECSDFDKWWNVLVDIMTYAIEHFSNRGCIDVIGDDIFEKYKYIDNEKEYNEEDKKKEKKKVLYPLFCRMKFIVPVAIVIKSIRSAQLQQFVSDDIKGNEDIIICIRSYYQLNNEKNAENRKPFELLYMLQKAKPTIFSPETSADAIRTEDDIWQYLMAYQYEKQLVELNRLGFYRSYVTYRRNDEKFRGTIDVSRHIRQNFGRNQGRIAYKFRKKTVDNSLNHLILRAYEYLRKNYPEQSIDLQENEGVRSILTEMKTEAPGYLSISDRKVCENNRKKIVHPFYEPYEHMRCLCLDIINGMAALPDSEKAEQANVDSGEIRGYLINVNDLFEVYIENVIRPYTDKKKLGVKSQYCLYLDDKLCITKKTDNMVNHRIKGSIRPDFVVFNGKNEKHVQCVIDAKNRPELYSKISNAQSDDEDNRVKEDIFKLFRDVIAVHCKGQSVADSQLLCIDTESKKGNLNELDKYQLIYLMLMQKEYIGKHLFGMILAPQYAEKEDTDQIFHPLNSYETFNLLNQIYIDIQLGYVPFLKYNDNLNWEEWKKEMDIMTDRFAKKAVEEIAELQ